MTDENIKLVWDIKQSQVHINDIAITVIADNLTPEHVTAVVEEQDTALVLGKPSNISISEDKPSWVLANKLESQEELEPGSVIIRDGKTTKLLAIVHDLAQEPSWQPHWIAQALDNIFNIAQSYGITSIQLPVLGAQHGRFDNNTFLTLLKGAVTNHRGPVNEIWLTAPKQECVQLLSLLKDIEKSE